MTKGKDMSNIKRIVIVEDHTSWRNQFEKILHAFDPSLIIIKVDFDGFNNDFKHAVDFDDTDYFFVDLELGPGSDKGLDDTWGLDYVLPHIRSKASWIPVALISRYIATQIDLLCHLSVSDFDGIYAKQIISDGTKTHPEFNKKKWQDILHSLSLKRNAAATGRSVAELKQLLISKEKLEVHLSDDSRQAISNTGRLIFEEAIALMDFGGTEVSVEQIVTGFSGVYVAKVVVYGNNSGTKNPVWLVKWGKPIRKLEKETTAHKQFQRLAIERSLIVHQLYPNVINWGGFGFIIYGFEEDALTAYEHVEINGISSINSILEKIFSSLYSSPSCYPISPSKIIRQWWGLDESELNIIRQHHNITKNLEITKSIIHGDLHLRNILIHNNQPTLIDFARSKFAPIAIDFAKIIVDTFVFFMEDKSKIKSFSADELLATELKDYILIFQKYLTSA